MDQATSRLKFGRLVAVSFGATAGIVAVGSSLLHWRTGWHGLPAAAVGAMAALVPLLMAGWLTAVAWRYSPLTAGRMFVGMRLTTMRFAVALGLLIVGCETVGVSGGSPALWFALLYVTLLIVEACWLAGGARRPADPGKVRE